MIIGCWIRFLVALEKDLVWFILIQCDRIMYGAGCMRFRCAAETKSRAQRRTAENSAIESYLGSREAGRNERINLPS